MDPRRIKLLHVEDNLAHRRLVGHFLAAMKEFSFDVFHADSEEAAVDSFRSNGIEFVLLDYHLTQGDGLSCLRRLRGVDPLVPIIALSGAATPEIASELLEVGADDYLAKQDLNRESLAGAMRNVLSRVDLVKQSPTRGKPSAEFEKVDAQFRKLAEEFFKRCDPPLVKEMDEFERLARQDKLTLRHLQELFTRICDELEPQANGSAAQVAVAKRLRPLLLEAVLRVFGNLPIGRG